MSAPRPPLAMKRQPASALRDGRGKGRSWDVGDADSSILFERKRPTNCHPAAFPIADVNPFGGPIHALSRVETAANAK